MNKEKYTIIKNEEIKIIKAKGGIITIEGRSVPYPPYYSEKINATYTIYHVENKILEIELDCGEVKNFKIFNPWEYLKFYTKLSEK